MQELIIAEIDLVGGASFDTVVWSAIGATAGAAVGFLIGGPVGAVAGGIDGAMEGAAVQELLTHA